MNSNNLENTLPKKLPNLPGNQIQISNIERIETVNFNEISDTIDRISKDLKKIIQLLETPINQKEEINEF